MAKKTVFFGIMVGDLFGDTDPESEGYDSDASVQRYGEMCEKAIIKGFKKYGEKVTVEWESQNIGGSVPWGLKTQVDGEYDHEDVEFVDSIVSQVWETWDWVVKN